MIVEAELKKLGQELGVKFKDPANLVAAFVHGSYLNEYPSKVQESNERLEFLGDAVLELVVTEHLYHHYQKPEGELTNLRSAVVSGKNLAQVARRLELGKYLLLSRGEELSGGREKDYIMANTLEAVIGAAYLDGGYEQAGKIIEQHILSTLPEIIAKGSFLDAKSRLQEISQEKYAVTPEYRVLHESGPDHDKTFVVGAYIAGSLVGEGSGRSKQAAERAAAEDALAAEEWGV
ncbi:MAG: ribonuclease III [Candidatus Abawacabacteria bacterium RIFCSPHIGHO2_01_FULL_46_8]|uniref:Ribonuclease 3 n=1 Tax=Candidatus Abawacabacteria bacterium RIFCSPHIGHO2_01_FULL_46_8 TaxID=1817815 RepID=A0A1F4XNX6_9BACT|nr:MAG: ribonuclease III [Candidatus Abawacabacteria bacterium RIFCSPHIGHO2_01_FULL_46_8]